MFCEEKIEYYKWTAIWTFREAIEALFFFKKQLSCAKFKKDITWLLKIVLLNVTEIGGGKDLRKYLITKFVNVRSSFTTNIVKNKVWLSAFKIYKILILFDNYFQDKHDMIRTLLNCFTEKLNLVFSLRESN